MHDARNSEQAENPRAVVAQPLSERSADCVSERPERSKRASAEAERRAKKAYAERWHKSVGPRTHVSNVRGYGQPRRIERAPDPETGREPQYNEPDYGLWTEADEDLMDAGLLTAWECFARRPCVVLMGRRG